MMGTSMQEKITIFHSAKTFTKSPISPYNDNTFVFETFTVKSNFEAFSILVSHFILNIPLTKLSKPIRTYRRKQSLEPYYDDYVTYIIIDIDNVKSEFNKQKILEYFKEYKCIIGESRSYNGIDNFNLKGILFTEKIAIKDIKHVISKIHHDLKDICVIDESVCRKASLNAPILKNKILLNNEDGIRYNFVKQETIDYIEQVKSEYIGENFKINISDLKDIEADSIEKLCLKIFQRIGFIPIKNNPNGSISFKHPSERKTPGGYFWFNSSPFTMHHPNSTKTVNIFDVVKKLDIARDLLYNNINYDDKLLNFNPNVSVLQVNEAFFKVTPEIHKKIDQFLNSSNGLFAIRSPMGTGKSNIIKHIIEECHNLDMKVLVVTNRISVAKDFAKKYNIKLYNQDKYEIGDSLICQYDSLWKYNIRFFDIVIMDEFISLLLHSRNNLNNSIINLPKFFGCFQKKLVIADAFLTGYENFVLEHKDSNVHLLDNIYRDPTSLYLYEDFNYFVQTILYHVKKYKKVTISSTSLSFINALQLLLSKKGIRVISLTAETPESTKEIIYKLFEEKDHDKWDVLIYSPTLTVGVSNLNSVKSHFHYDSSMSSDVISSIQMLKRTRKATEIHLFIKDIIKFLKVSYNDIRDEYMLNIGKNVENNFMFEINDYGEPRLSKLGKYIIKIDTFKNILEFNHKAALLWFLKYHFLNEPKIIKEKFPNNVLIKYQKMAKHNQKTIYLEQIKQYLMLNDIERSNIIQDSDVDKVLKIINEFDNNIVLDTPNETKAKILECCVLDNQFIQKSRYYKAAFYFTKKIWDETDIKNLISNAIVTNNSEDLEFYSDLLEYGQKEIFDEYIPKVINKNKKLKSILERCGYKLETNKDAKTIGQRYFKVDDNIKQFYGYIR